MKCACEWGPTQKDGDTPQTECIYHQCLRGDLSRALGEIDAAHVAMSSEGIHRSEGQYLNDRIARYIGETQTVIEELRLKVGVKE